MKIESVQLENIRSHVKGLINFSSGFNCIVGGLGVGKSSVLYAVDFALFGEPLRRSYDYLLREGTDTARIVLKFVKNGKEYTIQRALKRQMGRISQDMERLILLEEDEMIAEMKTSAVSEQLHSVIGIDREIFREIIWVRQEHLKDVLNMPPSERQRRLDQLFGLSDYEASWANVRPILRWYESERSTLERDPDIVGAEEMQARYNEAVKDLGKREVKLADAKLQLQEAEERLEEASTRLQELENVRRKNEELKAEESQLQAKIMSSEALAARYTDEAKRREAEVKGLEKRLGALKDRENYHRRNLRDAGLRSELTVDQLQAYMETLVEQVSSVLGEEETVRTEIKRSTQRISYLAKESTCPLCLQVLRPDYKERLMKLLYQGADENEERLKELEKSVEELEKLRDVVNSVSSELQTIQTRTEEIARRLEVERKLLGDARRQVEEKNKEERILTGRLAELRSRIREFDVTELEGAERLRNSAFEHYSNTKHRVQNIESQKNQMLKTLETLKERLDIVEKKAARLEKVENIIELAQVIRQAYRSIQPKLRSEFITYLERVVQQALDELTGAEGPMIAVKIDENYTPITEGEGGHGRSISNLSGGERTLVAFAYRLGIGQLIMQWRAGHGLRMLLLDEPTESLGREDGSIDRLAESLSRLRTVEQVIAVTHSEAFAEKADHVIRLEKRDNQSIVSVER